VTPDDVTPEAVKGLFAKTLPGFGELFRRLSYEEIGTRTIGSRAIAGGRRPPRPSSVCPALRTRSGSASTR